MPATYEIVATLGEYTDATGATKKRYLRCGTGFTTAGGSLSIKLDAIPGPGWNGWMNLYPLKPRDGAPQRTAGAGPTPAAVAAGEDDDIPF